MKIFLAFCLTLLCFACAGREQTEVVGGPENCPVLYVLAPENYVIDLAADANVVLDPAWHSFVLYCSPKEAAKALDALAAAGRLQKDQWRIYNLEGTYEDLVRVEDGQRMLACPARVSGWAGEEK